MAAFESENVPDPALDAIRSQKERIGSFWNSGQTDRVDNVLTESEFGLIMRHFNRIAYQEGFNIEQTLTFAATILEHRERVLLNKASSWATSTPCSWPCGRPAARNYCRRARSAACWTWRGPSASG